jgi:hypothetical protein
MAEVSNSDLMRAIGKLEGTVISMDGKLDDHKDRMNNHSKRIRMVERRQAWWAGAAAALGGVIGILAKKFGL